MSELYVVYDHRGYGIAASIEVVRGILRAGGTALVVDPKTAEAYAKQAISASMVIHRTLRAARENIADKTAEALTMQDKWKKDHAEYLRIRRI